MNEFFLTKEELAALELVLLQGSWTADHDRCQLCKKLGKAVERMLREESCIGAYLTSARETSIPLKS